MWNKIRTSIMFQPISLGLTLCLALATIRFESTEFLGLTIWVIWSTFIDIFLWDTLYAPPKNWWDKTILISVVIPVSVYGFIIAWTKSSPLSAKEKEKFDKLKKH